MKKLLSFLLIITLCLPFVSVYANSTATLPAFNVTFNGQMVDSSHRQFPLLVYKDITYVPMTYYDCRFLGLATYWDNETGTLSIEKGYSTCAYRDYMWQWENSKNNDIAICGFSIVVNGKTIDNSKEEYPLLLYRDVTYFPLTWRFAVDEFGWEYYFDLNTGLSISSYNYHPQNIYLPNITGDVATDGNYYYYSGENNSKQFVYRAPVSNPTSSEVIMEIPETPLTNGASFINSCGNIYFTYFGGSSAITGTRSFFKINSDGSCVRETPDDNYMYGKHGSSEFRVAAEGIKVIGFNQFIDGPTKISYEIGGKTYDAHELPGRVRVGRKRNGTVVNAFDYDCVQIFNNKIYYTAADLDTKDDSALYCIDTATGENKKILDGVCGFYVYNGWLTEEKADSTMIVYDNNGYLMRYSELNGDIREIENGQGEQGLILDSASGIYQICTVQKTLDGTKTAGKTFNCYASGTCIKGFNMETSTGTVSGKIDNKHYLRVVGESPNDEVRLWVGGRINAYISSDVADSVFIYNDILLYKIGKDLTVRVDLK